MTMLDEGIDFRRRGQINKLVPCELSVSEFKYQSGRDTKIFLGITEEICLQIIGLHAQGQPVGQIEVHSATQSH